MNYKTLLKMTIAAALLPAMSVSASPVDDSFYPYNESTPNYPGLTPGMTLTADNIGQFPGVIDSEMAAAIAAGDVQIKVGKTTSFDLHPNYVKVTRENTGNVKLGEQVGEINGWVAGRPFVNEPAQDDPRAGEKLAWNYKYGYNWGDNAAIYPFYWKYRNMESGAIERTLKFNFHFLNYQGRVNQQPLPNIEPNPSSLYRSIYLQVLAPYDVKNTQLLIQRNIDDLKRDNAWLYLGFQRRVRRLATGQVTDAFLGSDIMIEDFEGYNGRVSDMKWNFIETKNVLLPFYNHNDMELDTETHNDSDGYQVAAFSGKGGCYPDVEWQLRKAYVVEAVPMDSNHPMSKRVFYMDAQTFTIPRTNIYDRAGNLWKKWIIGQAHPDHHLPKNKGSGVSIDDSFAMVDIQANHCTTGQFKGQVDPSLTPTSLFTPQNMRATGR